MSVRFRVVAALILLSPALWIDTPLQAQSAPSVASTSVSGVVARVDGIEVRADELDRWWQANDPIAFARVRRELFDGRTRAVDALLDERVLESEAIRQHLTVAQLLAQEAPKRVAPPTDAAIRDTFEKSTQAGLAFEEVKSMIADYLAAQAATRARETYVQQLRADRAARTMIALLDPALDSRDSGGDRTIGGTEASVEIVEFADFQCPFCGKLEPVMKRILAAFGNQVRLVWKDFPLSSIHEHAQAAAVAARCAAEQGAFWAYHDLLFRNQGALSGPQLREYANDLSLDQPRFDQCVTGPAASAAIRSDLEDGTLRGVEGTPTVFINGEQLSGALDYDDYEKVIARELARFAGNH